MTLQLEDRLEKWQTLLLEDLFNIDEVWGCEVHLAGENYAGTTDAVGIFDGEPAIIDFKQTNKPKKKNGLKIIICSCRLMLWRIIICLAQTLAKAIF